MSERLDEVDRRASLDYWDTRRRLDDLIPGWSRNHTVATAVEAIVKTMVGWAGGPEQIVAELVRVAPRVWPVPEVPTGGEVTDREGVRWVENPGNGCWSAPDHPDWWSHTNALALLTARGPLTEAPQLETTMEEQR